MKKASITFLVCLALLGLFATRPSSAFAATVARVEVTGLSALSEAQVRDVIGIREGDAFSIEAIDEAIGNLRKWGVFDAIQVAPSMEPDGAVIAFHLEEAIVVAAIDVAGNYPYVENKVRKHLTLHPGDIYTPERLEEQIERVKDFYAREGYVGTEVAIDEEMIPAIGGVVLTLRIHRGLELRYRNITVEGNRAYPAGRFVSMLKTWRAFSERRLNQALREIRAYYQRHGWPKARIRVQEKKIDFEAGRVDLVLEVNEGPHVELRFRGAHHAGPRLLRRTATILTEGSYDRYEIERSAEAIREALRGRGYPDAQVTGTREDLPDGTILIVFDVDEGKPSKIRWLRFEGAPGVDRDPLVEGMKNREESFRVTGAYYPQDQGADDEAILTGLRKQGYLDAHIGEWSVAPTPQGYALDVRIPVDRGPQTLVGRVAFAGNTAFGDERLERELKIRPGRPFNEPGLDEDRQRIVTFYGDHGYPYASVQQRWERGDSGEAVIAYDIDEGQRVVIGHILIVGDVLTSQKAIKKAMEIREGDPFSYRRILDSQFAVRRLGAFSAVSIETIGLGERERVVHLRVKVEEQRPFQVDLGLAYSTEESLTGTLSFTNLNAFGWAKQNTLRLVAGRLLSRAEIGWYDPRFLSSSFEQSTIGWIQYKKQPSYAYTQIGGALSWFRRLKRFGFFFRWEIDRNYFVSGDSVAANADSLRNNTISRVALSSSYDSRDSIADPRRGFFTLGGVDFYDEIFGASTNFVKFQWQGENDLSPFSWATLTTALRFNQIMTMGQNVAVPVNELYYLGGNDTVRGYGYNALGPVNAAGQATGGIIRFIWNEELRLRMLRSLQWAFFLDLGSLTNSYSAISWNNTVRRSFGFGLRYMTPVGPIRADYGIKLDRKPGESFGHFHFTFGYVF